MPDVPRTSSQVRRGPPGVQQLPKEQSRVQARDTTQLYRHSGQGPAVSAPNRRVDSSNPGRVALDCCRVSRGPRTISSSRLLAAGARRGRQPSGGRAIRCSNRQSFLICCQRWWRCIGHSRPVPPPPRWAASSSQTSEPARQPASPARSGVLVTGCPARAEVAAGPWGVRRGCFLFRFPA
jgi:hypothetical protein